ncbi:hypothetical protein AURDEDRAFT_113350 [Auricularia subglabra TFB-10046 SS5]|nr:hypothetical protein AURDEDRAFT_113350 [Auricularia subglabra TFB-10046 SS5]
MSSASSTYSTDASLESPAAWAHLVDRLNRVANGQDPTPANASAAADSAHPRGRMPPPPTPGQGAAKKH